MSLLTSIQNRIDNKVFTRLGSTVVRTPYTSQTVDKWGDATKTYGANENVTAVPYSLMDKREDYKPFGDVQEGETLMVFKHNQTLNERDKITFDSDTYIIKDIEKFPLANGNLVQIARLVEDKSS